MAAKYIFFEAGSDGAITFPVENFTGINQTGDGSIDMTFEHIGGNNGTVSTASLSVTGGDEQAVMKAISEAIAFGKDQFLVIADDDASSYVHSSITACSITEGSGGYTAGTGITSGTGTVYHSWVEALGGGILKTSIYVDLTGLASSADGDVIGKAGTANSHIGQYTVAKSGTLFAGRMSFLEIPAGGDVDIDLHANDDATLAEDAPISGGTNTATLLTTDIDIIISTMGPYGLTALPGANQYLYLVDGEGTNADYTAGKVLIELFGTV